MRNFRLRIGVFSHSADAPLAAASPRRSRTDGREGRVGARQAMRNRAAKCKPNAPQHWADLGVVAGVGFVRVASQGIAISDDRGLRFSGVGKSAGMAYLA